MEALAKRVFQKHVDTAVSHIEPLAGGQVGSVFKVHANGKDYVVKFVEIEEELPFDAELVDERVYGARWSNLVPTYELLKSKDVPTPHLYASGTLESEKVHYALFDFLQGDDPDYSPEWFSLLGREMARIHTVVRPYQGWVAMNEPYQESWDGAFSQSVYSQLQEGKEFLSSELYEKVKQYIDDHVPSFRSPAHFVLSHTDGIQAVFKKKEGEWGMEGVIDVEDYQFTDQRFVLAGVELVNRLEGRSLPETFWHAYTEVCPVDASYTQVKGLLQVYYLLVWIRVLQGQEDRVSKNTACLEGLVR